MEEYLLVFVVAAVALVGILVGRFSSALKGPYWSLGYILSMLIVLPLVAVRCRYELNFVAPVSWLVAGRMRFIVLALGVTIGLTTPLSRLPLRAERILVSFIMILVVVWFSVMPFLAPALIRDDLRELNTNVDTQGVCFQGTDFTCGPAAAVTALRTLGIEAEEGELAVLAHSSPIVGTLPECLSDALKKRYSAQGLKCNFQRFDSIDQLADYDVALAVLKNSFLNDHCVAVLGVYDDSVVLADPVGGRQVVSRQYFRKVWRFSAISLSLTPARI